MEKEERRDEQLFLEEFLMVSLWGIWKLLGMTFWSFFCWICAVKRPRILAALVCVAPVDSSAQVWDVTAKVLSIYLRLGPFGYVD